jgi:hypothetical protein
MNPIARISAREAKSSIKVIQNSMNPLLKNSSLFSLVSANLVPLLGVLFFGWSLFPIMFLYWLENVVVGLLNVVRMVRAEKPMPDRQKDLKFGGKPYDPSMKKSLIFFFIIHYGLFTLVHGMFVSFLFGPANISLIAAIAGFASLFISHYVSYRTNFIGKEEYKNLSAPDLFFQPYKRIVILHLTVLFGGIFAKAFGAPIIALLVLIALKIIADSWLHLREHKFFETKKVLTL